MTWIKICGITNLEDAQVAVEAGADALGFVFYEESARNVDPSEVRSITSQLPEAVEKVGVFPRHSLAAAMDMARRAGLTGVQTYPLSSMAEFASSSNRAQGTGTMKLYWALPATILEQPGQFLPAVMPREGGQRILLDSGTHAQPGGTGKTFDWERAAPLIETMRQQNDVVIAGGLASGNVAGAIRLLKPWGVDVSSGVESEPGKKDPKKIRAFISAVRNAEASY